MKKSFLLFIVFLIFTQHVAFAMEDTYSFQNPEEQKRFALLTQQIRCMVCQNQNIADSEASLAKDIREKIYQMVLQKKSNEKIKTYLSKRYGSYILLKPPFNIQTSLLWSFPCIALGGIIFIFSRLLKTSG